jgi:hypothetical protein
MARSRVDSVGAGPSASYLSERDHPWTNIGKTPTRILAVATPPHF